MLLNHLRKGFAIKQLGVADGYFLSLEFGAHAFSGHGFGLTSLAPGQTAALRLRHHRLRQRMGAAAFHSSGNGQQTCLVYDDGDDVGHPGLANGQGAGLVEGDGREHAQIFQVRAALDQHAAARGAGDAGQHRRGGGDGQRARGSRHQHRHGAVKGYGEGETKQRRQHDEQPDSYQHGRHKNTLEAVSKSLGGRFLRLRLGHHFHHARQRALPRQLGHLDDQRALAVDGSGEHLVARLFLHRHGFAGDWRLVHRRGARRHLAVGGDALPGFDDHPVAALQGFDPHFDLRTVPLHDGGLGRQFRQRLDGLARPVHGHVFQRMAQTEQEQQQRAFFPGTERRRPSCRDNHQDVDVEAAAAQTLPGIAQGVETPCRVGAQQ